MSMFDLRSGPILVQTVCKGEQQVTKVTSRGEKSYYSEKLLSNNIFTQKLGKIGLWKWCTQVEVLTTYSYLEI